MTRDEKNLLTAREVRAALFSMDRADMDPQTLSAVKKAEDQMEIAVKRLTFRVTERRRLQ